MCENDCFYSKYNEKKKNLQNILSVKKAGTHIGKDRCMTRGQGNRQNTDGSDHQIIKHLKNEQPPAPKITSTTLLRREAKGALRG